MEKLEQANVRVAKCTGYCVLIPDDVWLYGPGRTHREDMPKIVSIDLQPMAPIEGVTQIQGDITSLTSIQQVRSLRSLIEQAAACHVRKALESFSL